MDTNFQKRDILKVGIESVVGYGVGFITAAAIDKIIPQNLSMSKKVAIRVTSFAISWAVTSAATKNINATIDALADGLSAGHKQATFEQTNTVVYPDMDTYLKADVSTLHIREEDVVESNEGEKDER